MKIPKTVLGALAVGIAVQATGCTKSKDPAPKSEQEQQAAKNNSKTPPINCPACGLG